MGGGDPAVVDASTTDAPAPHAITLAVWGLPDGVAAGERFAVKVGAKSSAGCPLTGCRVVVCDASGAVVTSGMLGDAPWPGTDALHWSELALPAPSHEGRSAWSVRLDATEFSPPHTDAAVSFGVTVVPPAACTVTVRIVADDAPLDGCEIRLGPHRTATDASGGAQVRIGKGRYELQVWKAGYETPVTPLDVQADTVIEIAAVRLPEDDPDAYWTR